MLALGGAMMATAGFAPTALAHRLRHAAVHRRDAASSGPLARGIDWLVMDAATGKVLSEHRPYNQRYPASLTKLMTLDLAFEALQSGRIKPDTALPVSRAASSVQPVKLNLVPGQTLTVKQAMLGMTTLSANDAATALGQYLGGGDIDRFARRMTEAAHTLGMERTEFRNPSGLPDRQQVTDAYDMALLTRHLLLAYPQYRYLFAVPHFTFEGRTIPNIDGMLKRYDGAIGMKTGYTDRARFNLVTVAVRHGHMLIGVELHARSWRVAYDRMAQLLDAGFAAERSAPVTVVAAGHDARHGVPRAATRATVPATHRILVATKARGATAHAVIARAGRVTRDTIPGWTAQVGAFYSYKLAKRQALAVQGERKVGVARVGSTIVHHHRLWRAQLAGLDRQGARATCSLLKQRHQSCFVIAPQAENLAMR